MKTNFFVLLFVFVLVLGLNCHKKSKQYFSKTADGIEYRFIEQNKKNPQPQYKGGAIIDVKVYWHDSLMFNSAEVSKNFAVMIRDTFPGSIDNALMMMHQGDSAVFKLDAIKFLTKTANMAIPKGMKPGDKMTFYIRLKRVLTPQQVAKEHNAFLKYRRDLEPKLIDDYIQRHSQYNFVLQPSGLYVARIKDGKGIRPQPGDSVYINYIGYFINGEPFASTLKKHRLFGWRIGDNKVIPGLELAVEQMQQGQVEFVIIPSYLAYGQEGLLDLIPPYSPLVFQVELVKVVPRSMQKRND